MFPWYNCSEDVIVTEQAVFPESIIEVYAPELSSRSVCGEVEFEPVVPVEPATFVEYNTPVVDFHIHSSDGSLDQDIETFSDEFCGLNGYIRESLFSSPVGIGDGERSPVVPVNPESGHEAPLESFGTNIGDIDNSGEWEIVESFSEYSVSESSEDETNSDPSGEMVCFDEGEADEDVMNSSESTLDSAPSQPPIAAASDPVVFTAPDPDLQELTHELSNMLAPDDEATAVESDPELELSSDESIHEDEEPEIERPIMTRQRARRLRRGAAYLDYSKPGQPQERRHNVMRYDLMCIHNGKIVHL